MKLRFSIFGLLLSTLSLSAMSEGQMPAKLGPPGDMVMFRQGGMGTMGFAGKDMASINFAYLPFNHTLVAVGLSLNFDGNGLGMNPTAPVSMTNPPSGKNWSSGLMLTLEYMIKDAMPFSMGPAVAVFGTVTPGGFFDNVSLLGGWSLWYAPFPAPIGLGTVLAIQVNLMKGFEPTVSLATPQLRFAYLFN